MNIWLEKQFGFLLTLISIGWAAYYLFYERVISPRYLELGPMQIFLAGLLAWLHGRYRRALKANRA